MACGCKKGFTGKSRTPVVMATSTVRSVSGGVAAGPTPTQLRIQNMANKPERSVSGMNAEKRKTQALRRQAIARTLGK